jgi:hypothetical protein
VEDEMKILSIFFVFIGFLLCPDAQAQWTQTAGLVRGFVNTFKNELSHDFSLRQNYPNPFDGEIERTRSEVLRR